MSRNRPDNPRGDDIEWCYDAVQEVSRTFALTVAELDEPMSRDICVGYLLCRVADTVEDAGHIPPAEQSALLRCYGRALDPESETTVERFRTAVDEWIPADPGADWQVVAASERVVGAFRGLDDHSRQAIRPPVRELVEGVAMFIDRHADHGGLRLRTVEELEEYCYYVAGTVGTLVTGLLSQDVDPSVRETLRDNARSFGLLLQLVNVAKDVVGDYEEENNVYLPREWLADQRLETDDIGEPERGDAFAPVVRRITDRAAGYLDGAQRWLEAMPRVRGNTLSAWAIPFLLAVATIRELERRPEDVVREGDVKVSRPEVGALLDRFDGEGDPSVGDLRAKMRERPLHEYEDHVR